MKTAIIKTGIAMLGLLALAALASTVRAENRDDTALIGDVGHVTSCPVSDYDRLSPDQRAAVDRLTDEHVADVAVLKDKLDSKQDAENKDRINLDTFAAADREAEIEALEGRIAAEEGIFNAQVAGITGSEALGPMLLASAEGTTVCPVR